MLGISKHVPALYESLLQWIEVSSSLVHIALDGYGDFTLPTALFFCTLSTSDTEFRVRSKG